VIWPPPLLLFGFLAIGALLCMSIAVTATRAMPRLYATWRGPPAKKVALTIDDSPTEASASLLDALKQSGVRASFFCIGERLAKERAIAARVLSEGHEICNHTYSHSRRFAMRGEIFARDEMLKGDTALREVGADDRSRRYVRAVAGIVSPPVGRAAKLLGKTLVHWTASARDGGPVPVTVETAMKRLAPGLVPGGILVIHDRPGQPAKDLIAPLAAACRDRGLELCRLSDLLAADPS
jgi:peptidoglycan/xylan/chitin deacetylase (PgdA/CDA1 family)